MLPQDWKINIVKMINQKKDKLLKLFRVEE